MKKKAKKENKNQRKKRLKKKIKKRDCWNSNIDSIITNYCYFSSENLEEKFGIENCKFDVIINFYTGNVISKIGMKDIDNKIIYRQYDSKLGKKLQINL